MADALGLCGAVARTVVPAGIHLQLATELKYPFPLQFDLSRSLLADLPLKVLLGPAALCKAQVQANAGGTQNTTNAMIEPNQMKRFV